MADVEGRRPLPRFEVTLLVIWGRQRFTVMDHLTKEPHFPLDPFSRVQAEGLAELLTERARERGEPLIVSRLISALDPPRPPQPSTRAQSKRSPTDRHKPAARSH